MTLMQVHSGAGERLGIIRGEGVPRAAQERAWRVQGRVALGWGLGDPPLYNRLDPWVAGPCCVFHAAGLQG